MIVDINKKYRTRSGLDVEIFKVLPDNYPAIWKVLGAVILPNKNYDLTRWCTNGHYGSENNSFSSYDLCEVSVYDGFNIDDKVLVWNGPPTSTERRQRYFAGLTVDGKPTTFLNGATSWSAPKGRKTLTWDYCEKAPEGV